MFLTQLKFIVTQLSSNNNINKFVMDLQVGRSKVDILNFFKKGYYHVKVELSKLNGILVRDYWTSVLVFTEVMDNDFQI